MANEHDDALEKVLAALNKATPPEGMETRIAQRLQSHVVPTSSSALAAAWWRGALSGAAAAAFVLGAVLLVQHRSPRRVSPLAVTSPARATASPTPAATPVATSRAVPCPSRTILRVHKVAPARLLAATSIESAKPSRPAPTEPLTAEERNLVRLTHIAGPHQLATLNPETQAKLQAQEEADFTKFFTPPPRPKPVEENE